jgi:hypothetical protein
VIQTFSTVVVIAAFVIGYPAYIPKLLDISYQECRSPFEVLAVMFWVFLALVVWAAGLFWLLSLIPWSPE